MANAKRDDNSVPTLIAVSNADGVTPVVLYADPTTHRLLVSATAAAAGSDTQVQFNDGGTALGGDAGMTYNKTTDVLTLAGAINMETANIEDSDASHYLVIKTTSNLTANRILTLVPGDAARTVTISGDATISQDYSTTGNPQFATIELGHATDTTLSRSAAGALAVEGVDVATISGTQSLTNKTIGNTNTVTLKDTLFTIQDDGDATKLLAFQLSGITTGTTRTITMPDASGTVTLLGNASTGSGSVVLATSPTLVTPTLGVASATSVNKVVITAPATSATLTIADGKTLTASNTLTLAGTDSTTITFQGTDTYVGRATTDTLTNKTLTAPKISSASYIADSNGNELILFPSAVASAVNEVTVSNAATGNPPTISATGGDTNIDIKLDPKGSGKVVPDASVNFGAFTAYFTETDNGNSSTADTIDWTLSNKQKSTLTGNCTFTFTAPPGPCSLILKLVQDGTGSRTVTWPAAVHWSGGAAPTLTTTASKVDIISFYYDGSTYFGTSSLNYTA